MHGQFLKWSLLLLLAASLASCAEKGSFGSIGDAYNRAHKRLFSCEERFHIILEEDPIFAELKEKLEDSEREREELNHDIKRLQKEIKKQELVLSLQGKVIRLLDDSNHTLQKNIEEQIAAQNFDSEPAFSAAEP